MEDNKNESKLSNNSNQTLFRFLGIELTAPKDLKYPRVIYIGFISINLFLLFLLRQFISGN